MICHHCNNRPRSISPKSWNLSVLPCKQTQSWKVANIRASNPPQLSVCGCLPRPGTQPRPQEAKHEAIIRVSEAQKGLKQTLRLRDAVWDTCFLQVPLGHMLLNFTTLSNHYAHRPVRRCLVHVRSAYYRPRYHYQVLY